MKSIKLSYNEILKEDIKLLRWLLMSYGSTTRWNKFSVGLEKKVERVSNLVMSKGLRDVSAIERESLEANHEYCTLLLRENFYYGLFGGPLLGSEEGLNGRKVRDPLSCSQRFKE